VFFSKDTNYFTLPCMACHFRKHRFNFCPLFSSRR